MFTGVLPISSTVILAALIGEECLTSKLRKQNHKALSIKRYYSYRALNGKNRY